MKKTLFQLMFGDVAASQGSHKMTASMRRVGQKRTFTLYMAVYLVISLPKIPYINRICMVLANPKHELCDSEL